MKQPSNKILLISPQHWGVMHVTKHHYAIELSKLGFTVFFLEPTEATWNIHQSRFNITSSGVERLFILNQKINIPYKLKFHNKDLYDWFIKRHIKKLEKEIGPLDIVWSFDLTNAMPLKYFSNKTKKIFFAADWPQDHHSVKAAEDANLLVSVAQEILDQYPNTKYTKKLLVDHAVAEYFVEEGAKPFVKNDNIIRVGLSGNFLRPDIDRPVFLDLIATYTNLLFECFGTIEYSNSNLGGATDKETEIFINTLRQSENVILHGMVSPELLAKELRRMDAFLICYDVLKDPSKGTNYHKVMEYLVYKRPIITNFISSYKKCNLFYMCTDRISGNQFKVLVNRFINDLENNDLKNESNSIPLVKTYRDQLNLILQTV